MTMPSEILPLILLSPVLLAVAWTDIRSLTIPNTLVLLSFAIFVLCSPFLSLADLGARLILAGTVFLALFAGFALRLIGGGDVKMISALMLFIPPNALASFGLVLSASMFAGIGITCCLQSRLLAPNSTLAGSRQKGKFPMGISIALAGLTFPFVWINLA